MPVHLDMAIRRHTDLEPFRVAVGFGGQGLQRRVITLRKLRTPRTGQLFKGTLVEFLKQAANVGIQFRQSKKAIMAQLGQNPAFCQQHAIFHFGLIPGFGAAGWHNGYSIVHTHVLIGLVEVGFVIDGGP